MATSENPPDPPFSKRGGGGTYKSTILTVFHPLDYAMSLYTDSGSNRSSRSKRSNRFRTPDDGPRHFGAALYAQGCRLFLRFRRLGSRFPRIFRFRQAVVAHRRVVAGEGHAVAGEGRVFELPPGVEFFLDAGGALLLCR